MRLCRGWLLISLDRGALDVVVVGLVGLPVYPLDKRENSFRVNN